MDTAHAAQLKQQAVQRVIARRRPERGQAESEFLPPETCGDWIDDHVARLPPGGPHGVAAQILEAGRQDVASAVAAVRSAESLGWDEQYVVWACLSDAVERPQAAEHLARAISDEWKRLGLHVSPKPRETTEAGAR
jgi:hypothetical protein